MNRVNYAVFDTPEGVNVVTTQPVGVPIKAPLQTVTIRGTGWPKPPHSPMTAEEYRNWTESLDDAGIDWKLDWMN